MGAEKLYDAWHSRYEADVESNSPWHLMVKEHIAEKDLAFKDILEIGCGRGGFSCGWRGKRTSPLGSVPPTSHLRLLKRENARPGFLILPALNGKSVTSRRLAIRTRSFDTVVSCETIEHVPEPRKALAELARVLKPGGRLFLTTPNYLGGMGLYRLYCMLREEPLRKKDNRSIISCCCREHASG